MKHKQADCDNSIKDFNKKISYIRDGIINNKWFDWDITFLTISIISFLLSMIICVYSIKTDTSLFHTTQATPSYLYVYGYFKWLCFVFVFPPFLLILLIKNLVSNIRKKIYPINIDPCIFSQRGINILMSIFVPFIWTLQPLINIIIKIKNFSIVDLLLKAHIADVIPYDVLHIIHWFFVLVFLFTMHTLIYVTINKICNYKKNKILQYIVSIILIFVISFLFFLVV